MKDVVELGSDDWNWTIGMKSPQLRVLGMLCGEL